MGNASSDILFRPLKVGSVTLPNRIAMAPMTREFARDGIHDPRAVEYYTRRARGGVGLLISEGSPPPLPEAPWRATLPGFDSEDTVARPRYPLSPRQYSGKAPCHAKT